MIMARGLLGAGGMSRTKCCLWALLGLSIITALMWVTQRIPIENDIQTRTAAALASQGHDWAEVDLERRGRDVALKGKAPSDEARLNAIDIVENVYGVREVNDLTTELVLSSASFGLRHKSDKIHLSGAMPTQALIDSSVAAVSNAYGAANVVNGMIVDVGVRSPSWLDGFNAMMPSIATLRGSKVDASDDGTSFVGLVETDGDKARLLNAANNLFGDIGVSESIAVEPIGPSPEELAAKAEAEEVERLAAVKAAAVEKQRVTFVANCQRQLNSAVEKETVNFSWGSANITVESYPLLDRIADLVSNCKGVVREMGASIEVAGHTDSTGRRDFNVRLSGLRANAVRDYIVSKGTPSDLLNANGYGEINPIANNATAEGRAKNRRIQFDIKR
jgi:outer membrane protein OmpA-like peptidoglycan-associated protein